MTLLTIVSFFFFNDTATTEIYTLSLHDALPISIFGHPTILCRAIYHGEIKLILGCTQVTHQVEHHFVHLLRATIGLIYLINDNDRLQSYLQSLLQNKARLWHGTFKSVRSEERRVGKECRSRW